MGGEANDPPEAVGTLGPFTLQVDDDPMTIDVSGYFRDPDSDALEYSGRSSNSTVVTVSGSDSSFTLRAVSMGNAQITVTATDPAGESADQTAEVTVVEVPIPGVPLNVEAYLDDGKPAVVWDPPANAGEAPVSGYEVQWRTDVDRQWRSVGSSGRKAVLAEAGVPGREYQSRVRATNEGAPWSAPASITVPGVEVPIPGVPLNVEAYLDDGKPAVVWDPPANAGEAPVSGYEVQWRTDVDRQWRSVGSSGRKAVLAEVGVAGRTYEFRVRASNEGAPWSAPATVTVPVVEVPVPGVPLNVDAYLDGGKPAVVWNPPANAGEAPVTGYEVQWRTDVDRQWRSVGSSGRKAVLAETGVPGREYQFRVRATNEGAPWSAPASITVPVVEVPIPGVPLNVEAYLDGGKPAVVWDPPANAGEAPVTGYEVQWRTDVDRQWRSVGSSGRKAVLAETGVPGREYQFRVRATNEGAPWSAPAPVTVPQTPAPEPPTGVEAYLDGGHPAVTWDPPTNAADVAVTGYEVEYRTTADRAWRDSQCGRLNASARKCRAPSAVKGQVYEFRVRALSVKRHSKLTPWRHRKLTPEETAYVDRQRRVVVAARDAGSGPARPESGVPPHPERRGRPGRSVQAGPQGPQLPSEPRGGRRVTRRAVASRRTRGAR